jgi:Plasma-membrane choline transporter
MIAGTVGSWWFEPQDEPAICCGNVFNSFIRTITTSFGSICFGSLLVAILQALRALADSAQQNGDAAILACIAQCILGCLASMLEYFNKVRVSPFWISLILPMTK